MNTSMKNKEMRDVTGAPSFREIKNGNPKQKRQTLEDFFKPLAKKKLCVKCKKRPQHGRALGPLENVCIVCHNRYTKAMQEREEERGADYYSSSAGYGGWGHDE